MPRIVLPSLHLRYSFAFSPFQNGEDIGGKWDLLGIWKGLTNIQHIQEKIVLQLSTLKRHICPKGSWPLLLYDFYHLKCLAVFLNQVLISKGTTSGYIVSQVITLYIDSGDIA